MRGTLTSRARLLAVILALGAPGLASGGACAQTVAEPLGDMTFGDKKGDPAYDLPAGQRLISAFGERPAFSPDGKKVAFIGASYGDAFEYDLATGRTRNLAAHAPHNGFLRVQYLGDGSLILLGPRTLGKTRAETRARHIELFWLDAAASRTPVPLRLTAWEGIATSRTSNMIAWSEAAHGEKDPMPASTTMKTGVVRVSRDGAVSVADIRDVLTTPATCLIEPQDFLPGDKGLTMPCYDFRKPDRPVTLVQSVDLATKMVTTYPTPAGLYGEVEGLFPDGRRTLVECAPDRRFSMEICSLDLQGARPRYLRLTRIMDYGQWKYGNPVVSPNGRTIAAQIGPAAVIDAGVGMGIVLMDAPRAP